MKRTIRNRWTNAVLWQGEAATVKDALHQAFAARADLRGAVLTGADLTGADLTGADLRGAVLTGAVLTDADLTGAVLTDADLRGAVLRGAVLTDADLTGAVLTDADLTGAVLTGAVGVRAPAIPHIDAEILAAVHQDGCELKMSDWHSCETTHCRAGWAVHLAGQAGYALEDRIGPAAAGALIYAASRQGQKIPNFYATTEDALADLQACAAADPLPVVSAPAAPEEFK